MEIELQQLQGRAASGDGPFHAEVCVLGGGIAGLTLAHKLARLGLDVLLVEAGSRQPESPAAGEAGYALGGTSLHWGGQLLPPSSLEGWPVAARELEPYWAEVERLLGVDELPCDAAAFYKTVKAEPAEVPAGDEFVPRFSKFAPFSRRNLGASLGRELLQHGRARVLLRTKVVGFRLNPQGNSVGSVEVSGDPGPVQLVRARHFILATGTRESCRLLATGDLLRRLGLPDAPVGLGCHDHLTLELATLEGAARARAFALAQPWLIGGLQGTVHSLKLEPAGDVRLEHGLPWAMAHFSFAEPEGSGLAAVRERLRNRQQGRGASMQDLGAVARSSGELLRIYLAAKGSRRRYVSPRARVSLRLNIAQSLPPRACLAEEATPGSTTAVPWRWELTGDQEAAVRRTAERVRLYLERHGLQTVQGIRWSPGFWGQKPLGGLEDARHAMGGAAMGADPGSSVVDAQLRVHGVANLWVASAAVLPDGRAQLPTMTLMALCLRLADRLHAELAG